MVVGEILRGATNLSIVAVQNEILSWDPRTCRQVQLSRCLTNVFMEILLRVKWKSKMAPKLWNFIEMLQTMSLIGCWHVSALPPLGDLCKFVWDGMFEMDMIWTQSRK